jgi:CBS domain-containing protein
LELSELISREPVVCEPETPLRDVIKLMRANDVGSVIVLDGGRVVGIFTERDLVRALDDGASLEDPVRKYMTRDPIVAHPEESVESALSKMLVHGIRHLPVVTGDGKLVGVVSIRDLVEALMEGLAPL